MLSALLITLREGLEVALIIGIVLAYLATTGNRKRFKDVWWGTALAIAVSLIAGIAVYFSAGRFSPEGILSSWDRMNPLCVVPAGHYHAGREILTRREAITYNV